ARRQAVRQECFTRELLSGRFAPGYVLHFRIIADHYGLDQESVLKILVEFQSLGMVTLAGDASVTVQSPNPKEMKEVYEIRVALEEIAGRPVAPFMKGDAGLLCSELNAMRSAATAQDLDAFVRHDVKFHCAILTASRNDVLVRVWDTLVVDLRIR